MEPAPSPSVPDAAPASAPVPARIRTLFASIAGRYDLVNRVASLGLDQSWRRRAVAAVPLQPGARVLDLAAGTGDLTAALARSCPTAQVVSTDFVPQMLLRGRDKARARGAPNAVFQVADACALPYRDASFEAVTAAFGVRNFASRNASFREAHRVLKRGGRLVLLEFSRPTWAPFRALYYAYLRRVVPLLGGLLAGDRGAYQYLNDSIRAFPDGAGLARELREAGFAEVSWQALNGGIVALHVARK